MDGICKNRCKNLISGMKPGMKAARGGTELQIQLNLRREGTLTPHTFNRRYIYICEGLLDPFSERGGLQGRGCVSSRREQWLLGHVRVIS